MPAPGGKRVARTVKETKSLIYLRLCRQIATVAVAELRQSVTCGFVAKLRQLIADPVAGCPVHAEFVERFGGTHAGIDEQLYPERERRQVGQPERFQFGARDRCQAPASRHARADQPGEVRPYRILVMGTAERPPPDMLPRRVVLQRPGRTAAGDRTVRSPLAVPLTASVQGRRPVIGGAILGIGQSQPAGHRLTVLPSGEVGRAGRVSPEEPGPAAIGLAGQACFYLVQREQSADDRAPDELVLPEVGCVRVAAAGFVQLVALPGGHPAQPSLPDFQVWVHASKFTAK